MYRRPDKTLTDILNDGNHVHEIQEKLKHYDPVSDEMLPYLPPLTHVRYITKKNGKELFRLGGFIAKVQPKYVLLQNNPNGLSRGFRWTVQRGGQSQFFRKVTPHEREIRALKEELRKLQRHTIPSADSIENSRRQAKHRQHQKSQKQQQ